MYFVCFLNTFVFMTNIEQTTQLGLTIESFKAAVYDYVALFDSFNIAEFINWIKE